MRPSVSQCLFVQQRRFWELNVSLILFVQQRLPNYKLSEGDDL